MTERDRLLRTLSSYDFAVSDLHIYLDTHPDDKKAEDALKIYEKKSIEIRQEYEEKFGPITVNNIGGNRWSWISDPWPWDTQEG